MKISLVNDESDEFVESFIWDAIPRPGDVIQFLNPKSEDDFMYEVLRTYWLCWHGSVGQKSDGTVQVYVRGVAP